MTQNVGRAVFKLKPDLLVNGIRRSLNKRRVRQKYLQTLEQRRYYCQAKDNLPGESRNIDLAKVKSVGTFHIDTLELSRVLNSEGFTERQSEVLTRIFVDVINNALEHQTKVMVTKPQQEIMVQQMLSQINSVKKDMVILEKSEFTMIKNDTDKQQIVIKNLESKLDDEIKKLKGQVLLDINLERGRATEAHATNEKKVTSLEHKIEVEHANTATSLKELEKKIDLGVSTSQTEHEKFKSNFYSGIAASILTVLGVGLGWYRLYLSKPEKPSSRPQQVEYTSTSSSGS